MYYFLLVINSNFGCICYRFRDIALKYEHLYSSVPYNHSELRNIINDVENSISSDVMHSECAVSCNDVYNANDGKYELSSDHIIQAGADLSFHIGFSTISLTIGIRLQ